MDDPRAFWRRLWAIALGDHWVGAIFGLRFVEDMSDGRLGALGAVRCALRLAVGLWARLCVTAGGRALCIGCAGVWVAHTVCRLASVSVGGIFLVHAAGCGLGCR